MKFNAILKITILMPGCAYLFDLYSENVNAKLHKITIYETVLCQPLNLVHADTHKMLTESVNGYVVRIFCSVGGRLKR